MRQLFPFCSCLLLGLALTAQAGPVTQPVAPPHPADHSGFIIAVPPIPRPVNPPPEYLLTPPVPPGSGPVWRAAQEDVLREAALRYLFKECPPDVPRKLTVYFLSDRGFFPQGIGASKDPETSRDPKAAMLNRFHSSKPPVRPVSELTRHKDWRDKRHQNWIIYRVSSLQWTGDTAVKIEAGSLQSGFSNSNNLFVTLCLYNGWWEITGVTLISA